MLTPDAGQRLAQARWAKGLSMPELKKLTGISVQTINRIEQGHVRRPHGKTIYKLAEALDVDLTDVLEVAS